jgi:hypothetical protein
LEPYPWYYVSPDYNILLLHDALELETSPRAAEAATSRSYLPVNYERVHVLGTLVPAITRSAPQKKGKSKKKSTTLEPYPWYYVSPDYNILLLQFLRPYPISLFIRNCIYSNILRQWYACS